MTCGHHNKTFVLQKCEQSPHKFTSAPWLFAILTMSWPLNKPKKNIIAGLQLYWSLINLWIISWIYWQSVKKNKTPKHIIFQSFYSINKMVFQNYNINRIWRYCFCSNTFSDSHSPSLTLTLCLYTGLYTAMQNVNMSTCSWLKLPLLSEDVLCAAENSSSDGAEVPALHS